MPPWLSSSWIWYAGIAIKGRNSFLTRFSLRSISFPLFLNSIQNKRPPWSWRLPKEERKKKFKYKRARVLSAGAIYRNASQERKQFITWINNREKERVHEWRERGSRASAAAGPNIISHRWYPMSTELDPFSRNGDSGLIFQKVVNMSAILFFL